MSPLSPPCVNAAGVLVELVDFTPRAAKDAAPQVVQLQQLLDLPGCPWPAVDAQALASGRILITGLLLPEVQVSGCPGSAQPW